MSLKRKIFNIFAAVVMVFGSMPIAFMNTYADDEPTGIVPEEENIPKSLKSVKANLNEDGVPDGTYDITLEIKGVSKQKNEATKANVIVVYDSSGSMGDEAKTYEYSASTNGQYGLVSGDYLELYRWRNGSFGRRYCSAVGDNYSGTVYSDDDCSRTYSGTRYSRTEVEHGTRIQVARDAVNGLANKLLSENVPGDEVLSDVVEMAFIDFDTRVQTNTTHTTPTTNLDTFKEWVSDAEAGGGTNWEDALTVANSVSFGDNDKTYIIFVSDGNPTFRNSQYDSSATDCVSRHWEGWDRVCDADTIWGEGNDDPNDWDLNAAIVAAGQITGSSNKELYTVGTFGDVTKMQRLGGTYKDAADQDKLEEAFNDIVNKIKMGLSVASLQIEDGITSATSAEIKGSAGNFRYEVPESWGDDWAEATFENGAVHWNPGEYKTLANNDSAKVTFTVWPSQAAMNCIAAIRNDGREACSESDLAKFGLATDDNYTSFSLITNSTATFRFKTATKNEDTGEISYSEISIPLEFEEDRDPTGLPETTLDVTKLWLDGLDPSQREEIKGVSVDLYVDRKENPDPVRHYTFSKDDEHGNEWTGRDQKGKTEYTVAPGVMKRLDTLTSEEANSLKAVANSTGGGVVTVNGVEYAVLEKGRDYEFDNESYTFEEDEKDHYYITKRVYHPMIVDDGEIHDVVFLENNQATIEKAPLATLSLENTLKGGILISKVVMNNKEVDEDIEDEYEIKIYDIKDKDGTLLSHTEEVPRLYRVLTCKEEENDEGEMEEKCSGPKKPYYNGTITEKIKVNQKIMVTDVPTGATYLVEETQPKGYGTPSYKYQIVKYKSDGSTETIDGNTVYGNASSQAIITNTLSSGDLVIKKTVTASSGNLTEAQKKKFGFTVYFYEKEGDENPVRVDDSTCNLTKDEDGNEIDNRISHNGTCKIKDIPAGWAYKIVEDAVAGFNNGQTTTKTGEIEKEKDNNVEFKNDYAVSKLKDDDAKIVAFKAFAPNYEPYWISSDKFDFQLYAVGNGESLVSTKTVTLATNKTAEFIPTITDEGTYTYKITERTTNADGTSAFRAGVSRLANDADITVTLEVEDNGDGTLKLVRKTYSKTSQTIYNIYEGDNTYGGKTGELEFTKSLTGRAWKDTDEFNFTISSQDEDAPLPKETTITADKDHQTVGFGKIKFTNKDVGNTYTYTITEDFDVPSVEATGTSAGGITLTIAVSFNDQTGKIDLTVSSYETTFTNEYKTTEVTAAKVWNDDGNRDDLRKNYKDYYVAIKNDEGKFVAYEKLELVDKDNYTFSNLPKKNADGEEIKYEVAEASSCSGTGDSIKCTVFNSDDDYTATVKDMTITNSHDPYLYNKTGELTVKKIWSIDDDGLDKPDSVTVELLANDKVIDTKPIVKGQNDEWTYTFKDLKLNEGGKPIKYSVQESAIGETSFGENESTIVVYDGDTVKGSWTKSESGFEVTNTWAKATDTIEYDGASAFTIKKVDENNKVMEGVTFTINDDDEVTDKNGEIETEISISKTKKTETFKYEISEKETLEGYDKVDGSATITMTCTSEFFSANPNTLVNTYIKTCEFSDNVDEGFKWSFDEEEEKYVLTVANKRSLAKSLTIKKTVEGVSPKVLTDLEFTIKGPDDFGENGTMTLTVKKDCTVSSDVITCKVNGKVPTGKYTVKENNADVDYFTLVDADGDNASQNVKKNDSAVFKITNKYEVEKINYTVIKLWDDAHDKDGKRPDALTVKLLGGEETVKSKDLSNKYQIPEGELPEDLADYDVWMYEFKDLPVADKNAEVIAYEAEEELESDDYEQVGAFGDEYTVTFVNYHEPEPDDPCADGEGCGGDVPPVLPPETPETGKFVVNDGAKNARVDNSLVMMNVVMMMVGVMLIVGGVKFAKRK